MTTKYASDIAEVLADLQEDGAPITFPGGTPRVYDDATDTWIPGVPTTLTGYAIGDESDPDRLSSLGLVGTDNETVWVGGVFTDPTGAVVAFEPLPGVPFSWGGKTYTVRHQTRVAPDGTAILYNLLGTR